MDVREKIEILKTQMEDLKSRFPAHSIPVSMIIELDELDSELNYWITKLKLAGRESPENAENSAEDD